jgi:hypothetical protein
MRGMTVWAIDRVADPIDAHSPPSMREFFADRNVLVKWSRCSGVAMAS